MRTGDDADDGRLDPWLDQPNEPVDLPVDLDDPVYVERAPAARPTAMAKMGRAILRLRLFWGWSQQELEARSGVDQTTISRLERGVQHGLSIRRLAAILDALRVGNVTFDKPPTVPQTSLEILLYGDPWERATKEADRRLRWPAIGP